jgi:hypothetical protein
MDQFACEAEFPAAALAASPYRTIWPHTAANGEASRQRPIEIAPSSTLGYDSGPLERKKGMEDKRPEIWPDGVFRPCCLT